MAFMHSVITAGVLALKRTPVATGKSTERQGRGEEGDGQKAVCAQGSSGDRTPGPLPAGQTFHL